MTLAARALWPYLLALHATGVAWITLGLEGLGLNAGLMLALALAGGLSADEHGRRPSRTGLPVALGWTLLALMLMLMVGNSAPRLLPTMARLMQLGLVVLLVMPGLPSARLLLLGTAQALACVGFLAGGPLALATAAGHAALLAGWLVLEQQLAAGMGWRHTLWPLARWSLLPLLPVAALAAWPALWPSPRLTLEAEPLDWSDPTLRSTALQLLAWAAIAIIGLLAIGRLRERGGGRGAGEEEDSEELLEGPLLRLEPEPLPPDEADLSGTRGHIIRRYLRLLHWLERRQVELAREAWMTPAEHARMLPEPAAELAGLFGLARYGERTPSDEQALRADQAAVAVEAALERKR